MKKPLSETPKTEYSGPRCEHGNVAGLCLDTKSDRRKRGSKMSKPGKSWIDGTGKQPSGNAIKCPLCGTLNNDDWPIEVDGEIMKEQPRSLDGLVLCPCCGNGKPDDDEEVCESCAHELMGDNSRNMAQVTREMAQVTREMAHDGGCPEMEGAWIEW